MKMPITLHHTVTKFWPENWDSFLSISLFFPFLSFFCLAKVYYQNISSKIWSQWIQWMKIPDFYWIMRKIILWKQSIESWLAIKQAASTWYYRITPIGSQSEFVLDIVSIQRIRPWIIKVMPPIFLESMSTRETLEFRLH